MKYGTIDERFENHLEDLGIRHCDYSPEIIKIIKCAFLAGYVVGKMDDDKDKRKP